MRETRNWLVDNHRKYNAALDECEMAVDTGEWKNAKNLFQNFVTDFKNHMQFKDKSLYPILVKKNGNISGLVIYMCEGNIRLAKMVHNLECIIRKNNFERFVDSLTPLRKAMYHHNEHERRFLCKSG